MQDLAIVEALPEPNAKSPPSPGPLPQERVELSQSSLGSCSQYICVRKGWAPRELPPQTQGDRR